MKLVAIPTVQYQSTQLEELAHSNTVLTEEVTFKILHLLMGYLGSLTM